MTTTTALTIRITRLSAVVNIGFVYLDHNNTTHHRPPFPKTHLSRLNQSNPFNTTTTFIPLPSIAYRVLAQPQVPDISSTTSRHTQALPAPIATRPAHSSIATTTQLQQPAANTNIFPTLPYHPSSCSQLAFPFSTTKMPPCDILPCHHHSSYPTVNAPSIATH